MICSACRTKILLRSAALRCNDGGLRVASVGFSVGESEIFRDEAGVSDDDAKVLGR